MDTICDIIVPIYNAYEDTVKCVQSVIENTDKNSYRLILINDKSSDYRIEEFLDSINNDNIIVLNNDINKGFVGTVNVGMKYSSNDVILLNSDTIVTPKWLDKLINCAYKEEEIATVTPLTNNGTICSIPKFLEDNEVPKDFLLNEFSTLIERISLKKYPTIPTAVGFCMYIKRSILIEVGYFDEETFGKGYGEENDFCCRCIEHGYKNVLCDDTYILHTGSMSFKKDKAELINKNLKTLFDRYPYYNESVQEFIKDNPLKEIHENIDLHIQLHKNNKKNILYVIHNGITEPINHPIGGTEYHLLDLVKTNKQVNNYILISTRKELILEAYIELNKYVFKFKFNNPLNKYIFKDTEYEKIFLNVLSVFDIDLVHVQHFINHIVDIPTICEKAKVPCMITLHDFYSICPTINLIDEKGMYCNRNKDEIKCDKCIKEKIKYNMGFKKRWNEKMLYTLKKYNKIIVPSNSAKEIIEEYYDNEINIEVIEHGIKDFEIRESKTKLDNQKFNIAFIGGLAPYKGSNIIYELINSNKNSKIMWHTFGNIGDKNLHILERDDLKKHGRYERDELPQMLIDNNIDLVCILSVWPETFSYTLSEAIKVKIPVIVSKIGAPEERVKRLKCGWIVDDFFKSNKILEKINYIVTDESYYNIIKKVVNNINIKTLEEMSCEYNGIYSNLFNNNKVFSKEVDGSIILKSYKMNNLEANDVIYFELKNKVNDLEVELNNIKSSFSFKIARRIARLYHRCPRIVKKTYLWIRGVLKS